MKTYNTEVVVVGAGAIGSAIARELSKYEVDVILVEKNEDIGGDASKSNSATIVCGYDAPPGSFESWMQTASNPMFDKVTNELNVEFKRIGAIQVAFTDEEVEVLKENKRKAIANGICDVELLPGEKVRELEPNLSKEIKAGLLIPKEGIVDLFELLIAYVENAVENGVKLMTSTKATRITAENGSVKLIKAGLALKSI
jgi:glycerol-3-phosphate dehydrogenase